MVDLERILALILGVTSGIRPLAILACRYMVVFQSLGLWLPGSDSRNLRGGDRALIVTA